MTEITSKAVVNSFLSVIQIISMVSMGNGTSWFPSGVASNTAIATSKWTHVAASRTELLQTLHVVF
jgi:hypothetical protein